MNLEGIGSMVENARSIIENNDIEGIKRTAAQTRDNLGGLPEEILFWMGNLSKRKAADDEKELLKYKKTEVVAELESETKIKHSFYSFKGTIKKHLVECEDNRIILC